MPSTPLICSSIGMMTLARMVSALAPGELADTWTVGGAISGYWVTGSVAKPKTPNNNRIMDITVESTGLSMNVFSIVFYLNTGLKELVMLSKLVGRGIIWMPGLTLPSPLAN